jgi:prepilin-type N-terminal cleavage/methylation domain-containing protein
MTRKRTIGFTLVELLIVISIIGLLATILLPALSRAKVLAYDAKCRAWVRSLADACTAYKLATQYYPGQQYPNELKGNGGNYTGTQVMAASLFGLTYADITRSDLVDRIADGTITPTGRYEAYTPGDLGTFSNQSGSVSDRLSDARPVLYWPWRLGTNDSTQCKFQDNAVYGVDAFTAASFTGSPDTPPAGFGPASIMAKLNTSMPVGDQAFVLIAAGIDRVFGTDDDIRCIPN